MTIDDLDDRATISVPEAGEVLGISRNAAYRAAKVGEIPTLTLGRCRRVPVARLRALLEGDHPPEQATPSHPAA